VVVKVVEAELVKVEAVEVVGLTYNRGRFFNKNEIRSHRGRLVRRSRLPTRMRDKSNRINVLRYKNITPGFGRVR